MGLFDKMKKFMGGEGMATVEVLTVNDVAPAEVKIGISDPQIHGVMKVTAKEDCTVLATKYEIILRTQGEEGEWSDSFVSYSKDKEIRELAAGDEFTQDWTVEALGIADSLRNQGFESANEAVDHPKVKLIVNCIADVKGSPFDPFGEMEVGLCKQSLMAVAITVIEGQDTEYASFPVADSVLKGTVEVTANDPATLVATKYEIRLELDTDGGPVDLLVANDQDPELEPNPMSVSFGGTDIEFPLEMKPGQKAVQTWMVSDIDLPAKLAEHGFADANEAVEDERVKLVVKCIADLEGAPDVAATRASVQLTS